MIEILKRRFEENKNRHPSIEWSYVEQRLKDHEEALIVLTSMEDTGGEPDVVGIDETTGEIIFYDCSTESPKGRRSLCYDDEGLKSRKKNPPKGSAVEQANAIGVELLIEEQYQRLQSLGSFDLKSSSWIKTPEEIRILGGAIFCERRYNHVFTFHNSAESYYSVRGWRGCLRV